jgi:hypothetical protein
MRNTGSFFYPEDTKSPNNVLENLDSKLEVKSPKSEKNPNSKTPVYPHPPVKVYHSAGESRKDIVSDFKKKTIIYMLGGKSVKSKYNTPTKNT